MKKFITKRMNIYILLLSMTLISIACMQRDDLMLSNDNVNGSPIDSSTFNKGKPGVGVVFSFILGRQSKNCRGFGVCEVIFIGIVIIELPEQPKASFEETDEGMFVAKFLLKEGMSPPEEDTNFYIDRDIIEVYDGHEYTIKEGVYAFDSSLGDFGGYIIDADIQEL